MRYEFKYVISHLDADQVINKIRLLPHGFRTAFPDRQVCSVYFDDANMSSAQDNIAGSPKRKKVRIRWYGALEYPLKAKLEIKVKSANVGYKELKDLTIEGPRDFRLDDPEFDHLRPVSFVTYRRSYFESFDKKLRITLDSDISYSDLPGNPMIYTEPNLVLEVKGDTEHSRDVEILMDSIGMRRSKNSKYTRSVLAVRSAL